jgi:hypothetical protein
VRSECLIAGRIYSQLIYRLTDFQEQNHRNLAFPGLTTFTFTFTFTSGSDHPALISDPTPMCRFAPTLAPPDRCFARRRYAQTS